MEECRKRSEKVIDFPRGQAGGGFYTDRNELRNSNIYIWLIRSHSRSAIGFLFGYPTSIGQLILKRRKLRRVLMLLLFECPKQSFSHVMLLCPLMHTGRPVCVGSQYICILGSIPRWHCIRSMQSDDTNPTNMQGIMRGLQNLVDDTKSMIQGRNIFAEYVIGDGN